MLGWVFLQKGFEIWAAGRENHLVCLGALTITGQGHICEGLLIPQVLEGGHHVGLEVVPSEAKLLLVIHCSFILALIC